VPDDSEGSTSGAAEAMSAPKLHWQDPTAPKATSVVPTVTVVVTDVDLDTSMDDPRILLVHDPLSGTWGLPHGPIQPGRDLHRSAVHIVRHQAGLVVEDFVFHSLYCDDLNRVEHPNGEVHQEFDVLLTGVADPALRHQDESNRIQWVAGFLAAREIRPMLPSTWRALVMAEGGAFSLEDAIIPPLHNR
jgi:ADP-ribose pyrophosphatase YjhB (NUDIX family)